LWQIPDFATDAIEVSTPSKRWRNRDGTRIHHIGRPFRTEEITVVGALRVTSMARTLFDFAAAVDDELLEEILDHALKRQLVSVTALRRQMRMSARTRPGLGVMRRLIEQRAGLGRFSESNLETKLARILKRGRFDGLVAQHKVRQEGRSLGRVDWAIPELRIAIEADGGLWHDAPSDRARDARKRNRIQAAGWILLVFTWRDCRRPAEVIESVQRAIQLRQEAKRAPG
jgi:very-short-patch-repair endonuclease